MMTKCSKIRLRVSVFRTNDPLVDTIILMFPETIITLRLIGYDSNLNSDLKKKTKEKSIRRIVKHSIIVNPFP